MGVVLLVRHGQASFGTDDYDVLSENGWEQGRRLGGWFAEHEATPTALVRGDMRRHRETLEAMGERAGWSAADVVEDPAWNEFDHLAVIAGFVAAPGESGPADVGGDVRHDRRAFQRLFERATERWAAGDGSYEETYPGFVGRVRGALDRAAAASGSGRTTVVVTSGGAIAVVCAALVDPDADPATSARLWQRFNTVTVNTSITRVVVGSGGPRLLTFNEHPHLAGPLLTYR
ncbi:histidine phosphatase family protein [Nocardioides dongxiaopingii]|uniref:histidine phosphatase family protein n=1 Tax=Nocardioides sp. S-1144 TaxID=2582905 RepID=UPI00110D7FFC|nr:histidine phosphatase family protein [Nocardioides sp. S-1144]QCW52191.1 histidine phosphatase family protein [Nocardioides sp. S-1144]